jgi:hypothetical protein
MWKGTRQGEEERQRKYERKRKETRQILWFNHKSFCITINRQKGSEREREALDEH